MEYVYVHGQAGAQAVDVDPVAREADGRTDGHRAPWRRRHARHEEAGSGRACGLLQTTAGPQRLVTKFRKCEKVTGARMRMAARVAMRTAVRTLSGTRHTVAS